MTHGAVFGALAALSMNAPAQAAASAQVAPGRQIALVTGSTDGLGRDVAIRIAATGAHVIIHGRNAERGAEVVAQIQKEGKGSARFYAADLASLATVREFAQKILRDYDRLNILVNNAGIGSASPDGRQVSADGHELTFAVNYLSEFLLTRMLLARVVSSAPSRIVFVSSLAQQPIDFNDVMLERGFSGGRAYAQSKLAQVMFAIDLANELKGKNVVVYSLHPATYMDTKMVARAGVAPRATVAEGAEAVMQLVTAPGLESGQFFNGKNPGRANAQAYDAGAREKLRTLSRKLTGVQ